jgi:hypothetical protein
MGLEAHTLMTLWRSSKLAAILTAQLMEAFMLNEVAGDELFFQAITRTGATIDSGVITRQTKPKPTATP